MMATTSTSALSTRPYGSVRYPASLTMNANRGYLLSLMFVLVLAIVGVGLFVGLAVYRDAWFKQNEFQRSVDIYPLYDDDGIAGGTSTVIGKAITVDEHEAPLVPFVDYDGNPDVAHRVLIGVRDTRFTSVEKVYYTSTDCTTGGGDVACVFIPSDEDQAERDSISYQQATQAGPSVAAGGGTVPHFTYAVGRNENNTTGGDEGNPGWLWRQTTTTVCPVDGVVVDILSSWNSKSLDPDSDDSCEAENFFVETDVGEEIRCQSAGNGNNCSMNRQSTIGSQPTTVCLWNGEVAGDDNGAADGTPIGDSVGGTVPTGGNTFLGGDIFDDTGGGPNRDNFIDCDCPVGWDSTLQGNNGFCCPTGSGAISAGQCQQLSNTLPDVGTFYQAELVPDPDGSDDNIFDNFIDNRPFVINTPVTVDTAVSSGEARFDKTTENE